jgi:hypothetical protein
MEDVLGRHRPLYRNGIGTREANGTAGPADGGLSTAAAMNQKNLDRNARLDALEQRITVLEQENVALREAPLLKDAGVWRHGTMYVRGDVRWSVLVSEGVSYSCRLTWVLC